ncbi:MAG: two-component regulator propeller domain-containing protein [Candidatus Pseudobacter hemicellulosilyticus]|uniref:histidine kinase n=1 Tax=Candidatus Pseudobacter hemicellulosilyticus TaxID=3121375 RepID=A0AAJ5X0D3_9BACT|nr:MAG: two-component regulator propeller domain-containing protein [Pseudobacter sp.]
MKFKNRIAAIPLIFLLLSLLPTLLAAQDFYFKHYKVEQGLSNNIVFCSLQDKKGFMWFGTRDGLNRFDGYSFKVFRYAPEDQDGIGSNYIHSLHADSINNIWVGTLRGLYRFDSYTEKFSLVEGTEGKDIRDIKSDGAGNLWFIASLHLYRYNPVSGQLRSYYTTDQFYATSISISPAGTWIGCTNGLLKQYHAQSDSFTSYDAFAREPALSKWIENIYFTGHQSFLVGTAKHGVRIFDMNTGSFRDILVYNPDGTKIYARDFLRQSDEEYWIGTEAGIFIYNIRSNQVQHLQKQYNDPYSLSDNAIYTLCKDNEGGIWAGSYFGGINYYSRQFAAVKKFYPRPGANSLSGNAVREIAEDAQGHIWIGTEDAGLNQYDPISRSFRSFLPTGRPGSISYSNIHGLLVNGNELWIGTFERGLDVMDLRTGKVIRHYNQDRPADGLTSNFIITLYHTRQGRTLVGTGRGLHQYHPERDAFSLVPEFADCDSDFINAILEDDSGTIWAGTLSGGIYYHNPSTGQKGSLLYEEQFRQTGQYAVNGFFEDSRKQLWVATEGGGFGRLDKATGRFIKYTTRNGLLSNIAFRMLEDRSGLLWISSSKGLAALDPLSNKIRVYTRASGLLTDQFNYNSAFRDARGQLYFGSTSGLISFDPAELSGNAMAAPLYLTGFQVFGKELDISAGSPLKRSITYSEAITLNHTQSAFSIDFAALSYNAPDMTEYAYMLEGLDKDWTYLKTNRKVYFTELPSGSYRFRVRSANSNGQWNKEELSLAILIRPPFWKSGWAYALYLLALSGVLYYGWRSSQQRAQEKNRRQIAMLEMEKKLDIEHLENEKEKELYKAKIDFFTHVAHEIRTPLTLIVAPLEKIINNKTLPAGEVRENLLLMEKSTSQLLTLNNQLLDFRRAETKGFTLQISVTDIRALLRETVQLFKPAAADKQLHLHLDMPQEPVIGSVDAGALQKILNNLLGNAMKYAASSVLVELIADQRNIRIAVSNDGSTISPEMREKIFEPFFRLDESGSTGTGVGLSLSRMLAELHGGQLVLHADADGLNVFMLLLPGVLEEGIETLPAPIAPHSGNQPAPLVKPPAGKPALLLVEDNTDIARFVARELRPFYSVQVAGNGREALTLLGKTSINIIISDIMMPEMDGFAFCKAIKQDLATSHIPVILLTARSTMDARLEGLELGADAYIEKPFATEHLLAQIANLLNNRELLKAHYASSPQAPLNSMAHSREDELFLEKVQQTILDNLDNADLDVGMLAEQLHMSRPTLFRKINAVSNLTPNELIRLTRLKKAAELLQTGQYKIYEVADMVGYTSQNYFSKSFVACFGISPSQYMQGQSKPADGEGTGAA